MKKLIYFSKPVFWLFIICYGLFLPAGKLPVKPFLNIPNFDKMVHFGLFFVFCLLLFRPFKKLKTEHLFYAPALALFFGIVLESMQRAIEPTRSSDFFDFLANAAGIAASTLFFHFFVSGKKWEKLF